MITDKKIDEIIAQLEEATEKLLKLDDEMEAILPIRGEEKRAA